jgi:hypothetical protein
MLVLGLVCFVLMGISEAVMDTVQFHFFKSIFSNFKKQLFWDPVVSWRNKYKNGDPNKGPKFPFSTTLLVGLTDGWHFFKLLRNLFLFVGILLLVLSLDGFWVSLLWVCISRVLFGVSFTIFYNNVFVYSK